MPLRKLAHNWKPHAAGLCESMQQNNRAAFATEVMVDAYPVDFRRVLAKPLRNSHARVSAAPAMAQSGYFVAGAPCTIVYAYSTPTPYAPQWFFTMSITAL